MGGVVMGSDGSLSMAQSVALKAWLSFGRKWREPKGSRRFVALAVLGALIVAGSAVVYATGGTKLSYPHLLYIPTLLAAYVFGIRGGVAAGLACGVLALGPLMPLDVVASLPQAPANWIIRSAYFVLIGGLGGAMFGLVEAEAEELRRAAYREVITGLPNGNALQARLTELLSRSSVRPVSYLAVHLPELLEVIGNMGPSRRDHLLQQVAARVAAHLPEGELFHIQTLTFGIVVPDLDVGGVERKAAALSVMLCDPFFLDDIPFQVKIVVGAATYPAHAGEAESLRRACASAVQSALAGLLPYAIFDADRDADQRRRFYLLSSLREAVDDDHFEIHYQPKIDLRTNRCTSVEALLRLRHPTQGMISPGQFIPVLEQTHLIKGVTEWVIESSLKQLVAWRARNIDLSIACNLSVRNIEDQNLVPTVNRLLQRHGCDAETRARLEFELTESGIMVDPKLALRVLHALNELGTGLAIDDFGSGHSSLAYLATLPVNNVKIDQVFAINIKRNPSNAKIIRAAIGMVRELGFVATVEGIEDRESLELVRGFGADVAQGYYFARPMPVRDLEAWLTTSGWGRSGTQRG